MQLPVVTMKTRHSKTPIPRNWKSLPGAEGMIFALDVSISPKSRLLVKVLVFEDQKALRRFWKLGLCRADPGKETRALMSELDFTITQYDESGAMTEHFREVDPRYVGVMAFSLDHMSVEYVAHECVHAAFAIYRRVGKRKLWPDFDESPEEAIAYPVGGLVNTINRAFYAEGIYARGCCQIA